MRKNRRSQSSQTRAYRNLTKIKKGAKCGGSVGDCGRSGERRSVDELPKPRIRPFSDQNGAKYVRVRLGRSSGFASLASLTTSGGAGWIELQQQGVVLASAGAKTALLREVDDVREWPQSLYVASDSGFHCGAFVKPDGTVVGQPAARRFQVLFDGSAIGLGQAGSFQAWQEAVATYASGQSILALATCLAFVGPILRLAPYHANVGFELVGPSSTGKTTALDLCSSVWGAPTSMPGSIAVRWRSTVAGLEAPMAARNYACFPIDEANSAGFNDPKLGSKLADATFLLSEGAPTARFGGPATRRSHFAFLSTSNAPISQLLRGVDPDAVDAVRVRLITIPVSAGAGVWDVVPDGCRDTGRAAAALSAAIVSNHGWAIDVFLERLLSEMRDEESLRQLITSHAAEFMRRAGLDDTGGIDLRRAQAFAVAYAAGRLAHEWGVLPIWPLGPHLVECLHRSLLSPAGTNVTAHQQAQMYVARQRSNLHDIDQDELPLLSDSELDRHVGFLKTIKGRRYLLLRTNAWYRIYGQGGFRALKELEEGGLLLAKDNLQVQTRVRLNRQKDRVYAVACD